MTTKHCDSERLKRDTIRLDRLAISDRRGTFEDSSLVAAIDYEIQNGKLHKPRRSQTRRHIN
jgi:hypothetical protein